MMRLQLKLICHIILSTYSFSLSSQSPHLLYTPGPYSLAAQAPHPLSIDVEDQRCRRLRRRRR